MSIRQNPVEQPPTALAGGDEMLSPRKGKKRVGWHASSDSAGGRSDDATVTTTITHETAAVDALVDSSSAVSTDVPVSPFLGPALPTTQTQLTDHHRHQEAPPGAPDALELSLALSRILSEEDDQHNDTQHQNEAPPTLLQEPPVAARPRRPVLRSNTSYDRPSERETADQAEKNTSQRQQQSLTDAQQRAHRLAQSIGSSQSAPTSRRNSDEMPTSFQPLMHVPDYRSTSFQNGDISPPQDTAHPNLRHRGPQAGLSPYQASNGYFGSTAEALVQAHLDKSGPPELFHRQHHRSRSFNSGTSTPIIEEQDYIPRPAKYRGGILASLLKLYNDDRRHPSSATPSGTNTPSAPATPLLSPRSSPPRSRRGSATGGKSGRASSLFNYHKSQTSTSSLALTELLKSSSMFAAPGSRGVSDQLNDSLRREKLPTKTKKERIRITVHIADIISRHRYLIKLCRALMMYGAPTHRLEEYMAMSARVLEIEGQFLYIPSCMLISFDDSSTHTTEVKIVRVPQGIDLGKLRDVHNIYKDVLHDKVGVDFATDQLDEVMQRSPKFSVWFRVFLYGIASASVAPFAFEGRVIDLPIAFLLGCIVGMLQLVFAPSNELYAHVFEVTASIITTFIARGFGSINDGKLFCFSALAQSSIALILPGYMVLCSSLELQSHNLVAGSVRMVHAMIYTLFLGYGITIGASLYGMMDKNATSATHCSAPLNRGWYFPSVLVFTLCLSIINQAKWSQLPVMLIMSVAGWSVNSYCSTYFEGNTQISNMLGALTIGILANLYSRLGRHLENIRFAIVDWWKTNVTNRFTSSSKRHQHNTWSIPTIVDPESPRPESMDSASKRRRNVGYSLAAAAMLPAIFVQVPSGLAVGGSLLAGVTTANQITGNATRPAVDAALGSGLDGTAFSVLFSVIQVAIGISVGLFMSALIVYPLGKRRSGLFSF
ncbi:Putative Duf1212 domain containing protein [[Torrubiella] hemipterigena]|uniref:Putative Duf1212 domain containing protein n=1 Tax=[Torrubiella] hemipterigena TaxID=1531966 RepID=A0A0A1TG82_9HYPO|nr:Putative Duf1212 domain containing protein [[Torrubiella] hemipterigena]